MSEAKITQDDNTVGLPDEMYTHKKGRLIGKDQ